MFCINTDSIKWTYSINVAQFVTFLLLFLGGSYGSTYIQVEENGEDAWISKFEKYIVLSVSLFMIVPFVCSTVLFFGLLNKHTYILKIWINCAIGNTVCTILLLLGPGIFFALKGTPGIAYSLIALSIILGAFMVYCVLLVKQIYKVFSVGEKTTNNGENLNRSSLENKNENNQEANEPASSIL